MGQEIHQIYDKIFKKILTLSSGAVVNLINGLFDTNYPTDSTITYNWTEFVEDELRRVLADTIITINGIDAYHMEAQMTVEEDIIFRVFQYGYEHADRNRISDRYGCRLKFPNSKVIYLYSCQNVPDEYVLTLDFGEQGTFDYKVATMKFLETDTETLNRKKMIILIPFSLLKMRKAMEKERTYENLIALKNIIQNDIIGSITDNLEIGNITISDARKLKRLTHKLYEHIYAHYNELEVLNDMTDESLMLDIDIIEKKHEEELAKLNQRMEEEKAKLNQRMEEERAQLNQRMEEERAQLNQRMEEERAQLNQCMEEERAKLNQRREEELSQLNQENDERLAQFAKQAKEKDRKIEAMIAEKNAYMAEKEAELRDAKSEIAELRRMLREKELNK